MNTLRAHVRGGRLVVDEPTALPEGTEIDLTVADPGDDLSDDDRAELHAALSTAWASVRAGLERPAEELIEELESEK
jgi:hypothetical protein